MFSRFRKQPLEIEACQWTGKPEDLESIKLWLGDSFAGYYRDKLFIHTLEGTLEVSHMDYIIRGIKGEHYPCKPDIFEATYIKIED